MRRQFKVFVTARAFLPDQPPYHSPATRPAPSRLASALALSIAISATFLTVAGPASAAPTAFLAQFSAPGTFFASTVPANGDENPYGIVNVPRSIGKLVRGDTLVSNFNDGSNAQGTGTTIVQIPPTGSPNPVAQTFAQINPSDLPGNCPGGVGLTTALTVLAGGFVVVGSLPVPQMGNSAGNPQAGCLIVLNSYGIPVGTWSGGDINGPWDMTSLQLPGFAELFVTNVLNGLVPGSTNVVNEGTVIRILVATPPGLDPIMLGSTVIGTGFAEQLNAGAVVLGPTGVALGLNGALYVADTVNSRIAKIPFAARRLAPVTGGGPTLTSGGSLNGPLGMTPAPNGDVITVNGGDGNAVETTPQGTQIDSVEIDPAVPGGATGDLFGLTIAPGNQGVLFVDDGNNTLDILGHDTGA